MVVVLVVGVDESVGGRMDRMDEWLLEGKIEEEAKGKDTTLDA